MAPSTKSFIPEPISVQGMFFKGFSKRAGGFHKPCPYPLFIFVNHAVSCTIRAAISGQELKVLYWQEILRFVLKFPKILVAFEKLLLLYRLGKAIYKLSI